MKKIIPFLFLALMVNSTFAQNNSTGTAFTLGLSYSSPNQPQFNNYVQSIANTLSLTGSILPKTNLGCLVAFAIRSNHSELEAGAGIAFGMRVNSSNAAKSVTASLSTKTFDIHFGYNNYIANPLFIGFNIGAISNGGKLEQSGNYTGGLESAPTSSNPFKGYVFSISPKAGLFFPFKKGGYSGFKLIVLYDLGLSKYDFYNNDIYGNRLKNYTGDTKSSLSNFQAIASLVFSSNK